MTSLAASRSRQTALWVNLAKVALLGALAPPVAGGIAERAHRLPAGDVEALVAVTISTGAIGAVLGAVIIGFMSDSGAPSQRARWLWVAGATVLGTVGLFLLVRSLTPTELIFGWVLAQFSYSGAMALLRALLATTLARHRRRGAVAIVFAAYGGLAIPLGLLTLFPDSTWPVTFTLAATALVIPLAVAAFLVPVRAVPDRSRVLTDANADPRMLNQPSVAAPAPRSRSLFVVTIGVQFASASVITALLTYHPLELAMRPTGGAQVSSTSSLVLLVGILGLAVSSLALYSRPNLLHAPIRVLILGGVILAGSLVVRALSDSTTGAAVGAFFSGVGVGINNSALLALALDHAPRGREGRYLGQFSAAGATGQIVGPMIGLAVLRITSIAGTSAALSYSALFGVLSLMCCMWSGALALTFRRSLRVGRGPNAPIAIRAHDHARALPAHLRHRACGTANDVDS